MGRFCILGTVLVLLVFAAVVVAIGLLALWWVQRARSKGVTEPAAPVQPEPPVARPVEATAEPATPAVAEAPAGPPQEEAKPQAAAPVGSTPPAAIPQEALAETAALPSGRWNWPRVFAYLVQQCEAHGGEYALPPEEVAQLKSGDVGAGWGMMNLKDNVLPEYGELYPGYRFSVSPPDRVLRCRRL